MAIPVGPRDTIERMSKVAEVVVILVPESFNAVGEFYNNFTQVEDEQVLRILRKHGHG